ncbi:MAG TPA: phosphopantothenoylcysteine decarboxylase [Oceanipulchritudo sp.]|nr:phosphopantothenoylcysteine decarboxylase [Oceanipulchritudo sp.]
MTAGPTREYFDPVRFLSNPSSGKMGYALARAAAARGWAVELVSGPVSLPSPDGVLVEHVVTGEQMYEAVRKRFAQCDILIMTAAIMDYRPKAVADHKIKKFELEMFIEMEPVIDVLATVAREKAHQVVVGFAAETNNMEAYALEKLKSKNADFIVANNIGGADGAFGRDENTVLVFSRQGGQIPLGPLAKDVLADQLLDLFAPRIVSRDADLSSNPGQA